MRFSTILFLLLATFALSCSTFASAADVSPITNDEAVPSQSLRGSRKLENEERHLDKLSKLINSVMHRTDKTKPVSKKMKALLVLLAAGISGIGFAGIKAVKGIHETDASRGVYDSAGSSA
ncbi:hypothetical protein P3T76_012232 [Phytophthora citrophthora]|uniref:RxLR effector protein n=1 Tax=Phytophthora citrophthora TaxID=4793 RepID=A0AAD9G5N1_9STRA|nr:hypothetical protein P3T76_012232 [Phytophthora citrophthora]